MWLWNAPGRRPGKARRPFAFRPRLLSLEDRYLPSTVTNLMDAGAGSLRQAIVDTPAGGTVDFQAGLSGTITLSSGELLIAKDLTIAGPGADVITVSTGSGRDSRVFDISATSTVNISALTIANAFFTGNGAGIYNAGTLTLTDATLSGNHADGDSPNGYGGGIYNAGTLTVTASTLSHNTASYTVSGGGGGIDNAGRLTVTASTLTDNAVLNIFGHGGAIENDSAGTVTIISSTFSRNSSHATGGAISNDGTLIVTASTLSDNSAVNGGAIFNNGGTATVTASALTDNRATASQGGGNINDGGGIYNFGGMLAVSSSTLSSNSAGSNGGGIYNSFGGTVTVASSTLNGNSTVGGGGGIYNDSTLIVTNSTFSGNSAGNGSPRNTAVGGGIYNYFGTLTVTSSTLSGNSAQSPAGSSGGGIASSGATAVVLPRNTLIAGNTASSRPDFFGVLQSQGHNLIGNGTGGSGFDPSDLVGTASAPLDPKLGPLADNGGPTQTMALLPGSPAIDAGDNADAPQWDQRGPGFRRIVNGTIDIGAFEVQAHAHGRPTGQPLPNPVPVQGLPGSPLLGQPPELAGDPSRLPDPAPVPAGGGNEAPALFLPIAADTSSIAGLLGSSAAGDLDALTLELFGGP